MKLRLAKSMFERLPGIFEFYVYFDNIFVDLHVTFKEYLKFVYSPINNVIKHASENKFICFQRFFNYNSFSLFGMGYDEKKNVVVWFRRFRLTCHANVIWS